MAPNYEEIAPGILYFPDAIKESSEIVKAIEETEPSSTWTEWRDWNSYDMSNPLPLGKMRDILRKSNDGSLPVDEISTYLDSVIFQCVKDYLAYLDINKNIESTLEELAYASTYTDRGNEYYNIKKYDLEREMGPHPDWEDDDSRAVITVAMYFNDNYVGGDLSFRDKSVSVKPNAGSVCIFPARYFHDSGKMVEGTKYLSTEVLIIRDDSEKSIYKRLMEV